jgi:glutaredoxin
LINRTDKHVDFANGEAYDWVGNIRRGRCDAGKAREMIEKSGQMSVPVIMIDGQVVIGFNRQLIDKLLSSGS